MEENDEIVCPCQQQSQNTQAEPVEDTETEETTPRYAIIHLTNEIMTSVKMTYTKHTAATAPTGTVFYKKIDYIPISAAERNDTALEKHTTTDGNTFTKHTDDTLQDDEVYYKKLKKYVPLEGTTTETRYTTTNGETYNAVAASDTGATTYYIQQDDERYERFTDKELADRTRQTYTETIADDGQITYTLAASGKTGTHLKEETYRLATETDEGPFYKKDFVAAPAGTLGSHARVENEYKPLGELTNEQLKTAHLGTLPTYTKDSYVAAEDNYTGEKYMMQVEYASLTHNEKIIRTKHKYTRNVNADTAPDTGKRNQATLTDVEINGNIYRRQNMAGNSSTAITFPVFRAYYYTGNTEEAVKQLLETDILNGNHSNANKILPFGIARHTGGGTNSNLTYYEGGNCIPPNEQNDQPLYYRLCFVEASDTKGIKTWRYRIVLPPVAESSSSPACSHHATMSSMITIKQRTITIDGTSYSCPQRTSCSFDPYKSKDMLGCQGFRKYDGTNLVSITPKREAFFKLDKKLEEIMPELKGVQGRRDFTNTSEYNSNSDAHLVDPNISATDEYEVFMKIDPLPEIHTKPYKKWERLKRYKKIIKDFEFENYITPEYCEKTFSVHVNNASRPKYLSADVAWSEIYSKGRTTDPPTNTDLTDRHCLTCQNQTVNRTSTFPHIEGHELQNSTLARFLDEIRMVDYNVEKENAS
ncbi:hypothetical protein [Prevotella sp. 10(H)]|uniref:hypothetical protein n=1 Tax=Prevotella sp. 10(H) TaxID=1158294 RepID=UPI0004A6BEBA|nr:hypothetical protein [Prevotella sp. 10(H)]